MKDRADFARKGIARGRSLVVVQYADGIVFVSENLSQALHKVSEIYDRIAFAAVGRYNEFENLRIAGVRLADMRGYAYDRRDVTGRGLANAYAQTLGTIFSSGGEKPYEVELFVAEVGDTVADDSIYRLTYDGQVADEHGYAVMGGLAEPATTYLKEHYAAGADARGRASGWPCRRSARARGRRRADIPSSEPRGRGARPHPHPAAQVQAAHRRAARPASSATAEPRRAARPDRVPSSVPSRSRHARSRRPLAPDSASTPAPRWSVAGRLCTAGRACRESTGTAVDALRPQPERRDHSRPTAARDRSSTDSPRPLWRPPTHERRASTHALRPTCSAARTHPVLRRQHPWRPPGCACSSTTSGTGARYTACRRTGHRVPSGGVRPP